MNWVVIKPRAGIISYLIDEKFDNAYGNEGVVSVIIQAKFY